MVHESERRRGPAVFPCRSCETPVDLAVSPACPECESLHCPYCGATAYFWRDATFTIDDPCPQLVAAYSRHSGGWDVWPPYGTEALPQRREPFSGADNPRAGEVFGELLPLLDAYDAPDAGDIARGRCVSIDEVTFFDRLLDLAVVSHRRIGWCPSALGMGSLGGDAYFMADPERFERGATEILARLDRAFGLL